ncbi:MAG: hypothetical protein K0S74_1650 [Chlamydiales bacterium]|jgi:hypothetical protein|nr:hypothetical protein [Chlamydiales bacterium]
MTFIHKNNSLNIQDDICVVLPDVGEEANNSVDLVDTFFSIHRHIESQYRSLPWPASLQNIVVFTDIQGGRGDIAAAAKAIALMQSICLNLNFDWVLRGGILSNYDPSSFLNCQDSSKVNIRMFLSKPLDVQPAHMLLIGPVQPSIKKDYIESRIFRTINGPCFSFIENAAEPPAIDRHTLP